MTDWFKQALGSYSRGTKIGFLHSMGASPTTMAKDGTMNMELFGRNLSMGPDDIVPNVSGKLAFNLETAIGGGASAISTISTLYGGFKEGGVIGAGRAMLWDANVNSNMVKYAYRKVVGPDGVTHYHNGHIGSTRLMKHIASKGAVGKFAATAVGGAEGIFRYTTGSALSNLFGNAMGGGVLGTGAAYIGGALGVKHAGKIWATAAIAGAGIMASKGAYSVFKAGKEYSASKRNLNTDGDMSAFMTQGAFTMRQRAVQAIARSHMNARSALGQEANYMHSPRSYTSIYRQG